MTVAPNHRGLSAAAVVASRAAHGINVLTPPPRDSWWQQYLNKFNDPVIRILLIAAAVAVAVGALDGKIAEGVGILVAVFLATFLAFWNEYRANKEFDVLNQTTDDVPVKAIRDGNYTLVPRRDVVVDDVVLVEVGEEVPADGVLLEAIGLQVNEAKLTGEARPVDKIIGTGGSTEETSDGAGKLLRGTTVVDGYGVYTVTAVGDASEIGTTLRESIIATDDLTPLNKQLAKLSKIIGVVGFGIALLTFLALIGRAVIDGRLTLSATEWLFAATLAISLTISLVRVWLPIVFDGFELLGWQMDAPSWLDAPGALPWIKSVIAGLVAGGVIVGVSMVVGALPGTPTDWLARAAGREFLRNFMIAVTIIVVAVPEGLAMSVTLSLAYSMRKMTANSILVRRMAACETIGAATVICSDKTGTLTMNDMRVFEAVFAGSTFAKMPDEMPLCRLVLEAIAANTTAHLSRDPGAAVATIGNPTDGALLLWLESAGVDYLDARHAFVVHTQWTFTTERKFMATLGKSTTLNGDVLHVKGAPEIVLARCDHVHDNGALTTELREAIRESLMAYQARGMRTLGLAYRPLTHAFDHTTAVEDVAVGLVWLGFVAVADPIRPEVMGAIAACQTAGVQVKIVTGDNAETAREIARQIGLAGPNEPSDRFLTGPALAALADPEAARAVERLIVLARARPADKLRLVRLLKGRNEVVAVTGDGVNDGPALNYADVGLAMGKTGTAVAKEASDIILLDDSFHSITTAIRWGRSLYENIQRFILFQLTINVAALGIAVLGPFLGFELPLTVLQMLWVNLIMDTFAALALATEPPNNGVMTRPPRHPDAFIVTRAMAVELFLTAGVFLVALVGLIVYLSATGELIDSDTPSRAGTILFTIFVLLQFWNLFNAKCMNRTGSVFLSLANNPSFLIVATAILGGQVLLVSFGGTVFRTVPLHWDDWLMLLAGTSTVLWVGEFRRLVARIASRSAAR